jgi:hypothetical protein
MNYRSITPNLLLKIQELHESSGRLLNQCLRILSGGTDGATQIDYLLLLIADLEEATSSARKTVLRLKENVSSGLMPTTNSFKVRTRDV